MVRFEPVTSAANPLLKEVRKAAARGTLTPDGLWLADGFHLLEEALSAALEIPVVIVAESVRESVETRMSRGGVGRIVLTPDSLLESVAGTPSSQGVIALVRPPEWSL